MAGVRRVMPICLRHCRHARDAPVGVSAAAEPTVLSCRELGSVECPETSVIRFVVIADAQPDRDHVICAIGRREVDLPRPEPQPYLPVVALRQPYSRQLSDAARFSIRAEAPGRDQSIENTVVIAHGNVNVFEIEIKGDSGAELDSQIKGIQRSPLV